LPPSVLALSTTFRKAMGMKIEEISAQIIKVKLCLKVKSLVVLSLNSQTHSIGY
jgi:hypothetical protein